MPFLSYKGPKGAIKHHFVPSGKFLFFIRFWWGFFYWIPLKERWDRYSIRFSLSPTVSEKNWTEVREKFNFSKIFISPPISMGFVANDSLWKMQQKLFPSIFLYILPFWSYKELKWAEKCHFVPSGKFLFPTWFSKCNRNFPNQDANDFTFMGDINFKMLKRMLVFPRSRHKLVLLHSRKIEFMDTRFVYQYILQLLIRNAIPPLLNALCTKVLSIKQY